MTLAADGQEVERDFVNLTTTGTSPETVSYEADEDRQIVGFELTVDTDGDADGDTNGSVQVHLGSQQGIVQNGVAKDHNRIFQHNFRMSVDITNGQALAYGLGNFEVNLFDSHLEWKEGQTLQVRLGPAANTHGIDVHCIVYYKKLGGSL